MNVRRIFHLALIQLVVLLNWNHCTVQGEQQCVLENREGKPTGILVPAVQCTTFREQLESVQATYDESQLVCCPVFQSEPNCGRISQYADVFSYDSRETRLDQFSWAAMVLLRWVKQHVCSGSLISTWFVLSAAHCFVDVRGVSKPASDYRVRLGDWDLGEDEDCMYVRGRQVCNLQQPEDYAVEMIVNHGSFYQHRKDFLHDIALLKLERSVEYGAQIGPACLPNWSTEVPEVAGQSFTAFGWGKTRAFMGLTRKYKVEMASRNISVCIRVYGLPKAEASRIQLCAGGTSRRDVCYGDSGGGLMRREANRWVLVGIISFGSYNCEKHLPGVYINVAHYIDWIQWAIDDSLK